MKQGLTMQDFRDRLNEYDAGKRDFIVAANQTSVVQTEEGNLKMTLGGGGLNISENCHRQLAANLGISAGYYFKCLNHGVTARTKLLDHINFWLSKNQSSRMVRVLNGQARAWLSNSYLRIDNKDFFDNALPIVAEAGAEIKSAYIDSDRAYIKAVLPMVQGEVKVDDYVQAGFVLKNTETGNGALSIEFLLFRLVCLNGMVVGDKLGSFRRIHRTATIDLPEGRPFMPIDPITVTCHDFWANIKAAIAVASDSEKFQGYVNRLKALAAQELDVDPDALADTLRKKHGLREHEANNIMAEFSREGDKTVYGLVNAITQVSQSVENYNRASDLEEIGGDIFRQGLRLAA